MGTYVINRVHFVWSTRDRQWLIDPSWQDQLFSYLAGISRNKKSKMLCAGGMPDHIHVLVSLSATILVAAMANALKANSSRWIRANVQDGQPFSWQHGYGAFSVSASATQQVTRYIQRQQQHHRKQGFQAELIALLEKHQAEYDERYLWT